MSAYRIGIDIGGAKIEIAALGADGSLVFRKRAPTPHLYAEIIAVIARLVLETEAEIGAPATVGIGFPGRVDPRTNLLKSSTSLDGHASVPKSAPPSAARCGSRTMPVVSL